MQQKQLGNSDLHLSPIILGGNVFGWTLDEKRSFEILDHFVDAGFETIDTADVYSSWAPGNKGGESETIIGKWMKQKGNREKVIIATKVGGDMGQGKKDNSASYITSAVEQSLKRLGTDYIDLYQNHWDDETTPVEETLQAFTTLIQQGKVRWAGASNMTPERLKASVDASRQNGLAQYQSLQPLYNLYEREQFEENYEQFCIDNNIGVINYYSLASGFLTGKYRSEADLNQSKRGGGIKKYLTPRGQNLLAALDSVADKYKTTQAAVALAWLMSRPSVTAPIASATSERQLKSFTDAAALKLNQEDLDILNVKG
ncbi:MAG: aldo/keto reductase [Chitinophagaceae bacterium]|nr:MAG: aldo/keto reductase [Chitinophagaceae bacterium]